MSATAWLESVNSRSGNLDPEWYQDCGDVLDRVVEDFQTVNDSIQQQGPERRLVSHAVLVAGAMRAAAAWLPFTQACSHGSKEMAFAVEVLIPRTTTKPTLTRATAYLAFANEELLKTLESRSPAHMPCSLLAMNMKGFYGKDLNTMDKFGIMTSIRGSVNRASVQEAVSKGAAEVQFDACDAVTGFSDLYAGGVKVTEVRDSDGYVNASMLLKTCFKTPSEYLRIAANSRFLRSLKTPAPAIELATNKDGTTWVCPAGALHMAEWGGNVSAVQVLATYRESFEESSDHKDSSIPDEIAVEPIAVGCIDTVRRSSDMYVHGSRLVNSMGFEWGACFHANSTVRFMADLSAKTGIPLSELAYISTGVRSEAWIHPEIAAHLVSKYQPSLEAEFKELLSKDIAVSPEYVTIRNSAGKVISRMRVSDGYHDACVIFREAPVKVAFSNFKKLDDMKPLFESLENPVDITRGAFGGTWVHPRPSRLYAAKCGVEGYELIGEGDVVTFTAMYDDDGKYITERRSSDGYVNATKICEYAGKRWSRFYNTDATKEALAALSEELGIEKLIDSRKKGDQPGTWVHPRVVDMLVRWCSPTLSQQKCFQADDAEEVTQESEDESAEEALFQQDTVPVSVDPCLALADTFDIDEVTDGYMLNGKKIRKDEGPPVKISVYDVMCAITNHDSKYVSKEFTRIASRHPEVLASCQNLKFLGRGQRDTPVTDARGLVMIMNLLPGRQAAQFRMMAADVLVRYLGGDQTLISEIQRNAVAQDALPEDNIGRLFGDAVAESSQGIVIASRAPPVTLDSVTGFIDMRGPQNYFRLTDSSLWSNVHPCGRPDLVMEPEELAKHAVVKIGCNGESTGRQPAHELSLKGSKLLDSIPTKCYTYVEQRAKDVWKNNNELFEGTHWGKTTRDTELLLIRTQVQYSRAVELVQDLVEEAERSGDLKLQLEREKTKQVEAESAAKQAESAAKQADSAARIAEAEVRKLELQIEIDRMRATGSQTR